MRRLFFAELRKVWRSRAVAGGVLFLLAVQLFLLWADGARGSVPPAGYRRAAAALAPLNTTEQRALLKSRLEELETMLRVKSLLRTVSQGAVSFPEEDTRLLREQTDTYIAREYLRYTDDLESEYKLVRALYSEVETVAAYPDFLNGVLQRAQELGGIGIFDRDAFNRRSIEATANAYKGLETTVVRYAPQKGLLTALNFSMTDVVLLLGMLVLAFGLVREEKDSGMLALVRSTAGGRCKTACAKLLALAASLAAMVLLLYGLNLAYCQLMYGLGPLERSIQSAPSLMRSTLPVTAGQYILLFVAAKWLAALVCGLWVMLACLAARRAAAGYGLALALPAASFALRQWIPAAGHWNVLKYANFAGLLQTNELLGGYHNLYWFGHPAPIAQAEGIWGLAAALALAAGFFALFEKGKFTPQQRRARRVKKQRAIRFIPLWRQESYKLLVLEGAALVLAVFAGVQIYTTAGQKTFHTPEDIFYREYMTRLAGPYNGDARQTLKGYLEELQPLFETQNHNASLSPDASFSFYAMEVRYQVLQSRVLPKAWRVWAAEKEGKQWQLVYEPGYERLFSLNGRSAPLRDALLTALLCALCFGGVFAAERSTGMEAVVGATPLGRRATVTAKLRCCAAVCGIITLLVWLPTLWAAVGLEGLTALSAPAASLPPYEKSGGFWPLWLLLALEGAARWLACCTGAAITLVFSYRLKSGVAAMAAAGLCLGLPLLLEWAGVQGARWLSLYPLMHFAAQATSLSTAAAAWLWAIVCAGVVFLSGEFLYKNFGRAQSGA